MHEASRTFGGSFTGNSTIFFHIQIPQQFPDHLPFGFIFNMGGYKILASGVFPRSTGKKVEEREERAKVRDYNSQYMMPEPIQNCSIDH